MEEELYQAAQKDGFLIYNPTQEKIKVVVSAYSQDGSLYFSGYGTTGNFVQGPAKLFGILNSSLETKKDTNLCQKCGHEAKERELFLEKFFGCMC